MKPSPQVTGVWPVRVGWALLPLTIGPVLGAALDDSSRPVQLSAAIVTWACWAAILLATLVPRTVSLTAVRTAVPAAAAATGWAVVDVAGGDGSGASAVVAACWSALLVVVAFAPTTGEAFVDGSSYGDERRMPLRVPPALLLGPLPLAWSLCVGPPVAAVLLLAAGQWVVGAVAVVLTAVAAPSAARALHGLARRWVVLVPAGLVLHDPMSLTEPVLFTRAAIRAFGPAPAGSASLDLTRGALGLALQLDLAAPHPLGLVAGRRAPVETTEATSVLFTPTRPGAVLAAAAERRIAVG
jgi:hypothetical protein